MGLELAKVGLTFRYQGRHNTLCDWTMWQEWEEARLVHNTSIENIVSSTKLITITYPHFRGMWWWVYFLGKNGSGLTEASKSVTVHKEIDGIYQKHFEKYFHQMKWTTRSSSWVYVVWSLLKAMCSQPLRLINLSFDSITHFDGFQMLLLACFVTNLWNDSQYFTSSKQI